MEGILLTGAHMVHKESHCTINPFSNILPSNCKVPRMLTDCETLNPRASDNADHSELLTYLLIAKLGNSVTLPVLKVVCQGFKYESHTSCHVSHPCVLPILQEIRFHHQTTDQKLLTLYCTGSEPGTPPLARMSVSDNLRKRIESFHQDYKP